MLEEKTFENVPVPIIPTPGFVPTVNFYNTKDGIRQLYVRVWYEKGAKGEKYFSWLPDWFPTNRVGYLKREFKLIELPNA